MDIAWELKKLRMQHRITLYEMEEQSENLHHSLISRIENNKHKPMFYTVERILDTMGYELQIVKKQKS